MSLQDLILTAGNLLLSASLIPSITSSNKPALSTSVMTGSILFVFGIVYMTLSLWVTVFAIYLSVTLWFVLAVQKYRQQKQNKQSTTSN